MNKKKIIIAVVVIVFVAILITASVIYGNIFADWMLRVHHLR